ncbi:MAG: hypothetical protein JO092_09245, partial [Candidatus Eremiobacteraeota bacterium]|nr:hypothetical protein [Candidatus Eremiobacteraeota bacterium]
RRRRISNHPPNVAGDLRLILANQRIDASLRYGGLMDDLLLTGMDVCHMEEAFDADPL